MKPLKSLKPGHAVAVVWKDSTSLTGWQYGPWEDMMELATIYTVGLIVESTPQMLTLTTSIGAKGAVMDPIGIPWGAIEAAKKITGTTHR